MSEINLTRRVFLNGMSKSMLLPVVGLGLSLYGDSSWSMVDQKLSEGLIPNISVNDIPGFSETITINEIPFLLHGITHTKEFATKHKKILEDLVENSSCLITEANPEELVEGISTEDGISYFGQIFENAYVSNKSVFHVDPVSVTNLSLDTVATLIGIFTMYSGSKYGGRLLKINSGIESLKKEINYLDESSGSLSEEMEDYNISLSNILSEKLGIYQNIVEHELPNFNKNLLKVCLGAYLLSNDSGISMGIKNILSNKIDDENYTGQAEFLLFNHIIDQRNFEIAQRILYLTNECKTFQSIAKSGPYVLLEYGGMHIAGIKQYLESPDLRKIKQAEYAWNYSLFDSNEVSLFTPSVKGSWNKTLL